MAKKYNMVFEEFRDFGTLLSTLKSRPNNHFMSNENSSTSGSSSFTGTRSYTQAVKMLSEGYTDAIGRMKKNITAKNKLNAKYEANIEHPIPHNSIVGFIPNVPNAIQGIPQSMISINRKPMKKKTISIFYAIGGSCNKKTSWFEEAGVAFLSAIDFIEKSGIQTKIQLAFFTGKQRDEGACPYLTIKNYGERYSIQKISFPLVHPSMFRRIGFKWIETTPDTKENWSCGYGGPMTAEELEENIKKDNQTYVLGPQWIQEHNCSVEDILKKLEVI